MNLEKIYFAKEEQSITSHQQVQLYLNMFFDHHILPDMYMNNH